MIARKVLWCVLLCALAVALALLTSCPFQAPEFDNPNDPANRQSEPNFLGEFFSLAVDTGLEFMIPATSYGVAGEKYFMVELYDIEDESDLTLDTTGETVVDLAQLERGHIILDGRLTDWSGIVPIATGFGGEGGERPGSTLESVSMATGASGELFVAIELTDNTPNPGNFYALFLDDYSVGFGSRIYYAFHDGIDWSGGTVNFDVGRGFLSLDGIINDMPFNFSTSQATVRYEPDDGEWGNLSIVDPVDDTGIEFRQIGKITGMGTYTVGQVEPEIEMGVWSPPAIEPDFGYGNTPACEGTVNITRYDELLEGTYDFFCDTLATIPLEITGSFEMENPLEN